MKKRPKTGAFFYFVAAEMPENRTGQQISGFQ